MKIKERFRGPLIGLTIPVFALSIYVLNLYVAPIKNKDAVRLAEINYSINPINDYINNTMEIKIGDLQNYSNLDSLLEDKTLMKHPDFSIFKAEVKRYKYVKSEHDSLEAIPGVAELAEQHEARMKFIQSPYAPLTALGIVLVSTIPAALGLFLPVYDNKKKIISLKSS